MSGLAFFADVKVEVPSPVAVLPILQPLIDSFEGVAAEHGVTLARARLEPLVLQSSVEALERIAVNLISNAIKYTPAGGSVVVSCEAHVPWGLLVVADNGRGIASSEQERIFRPFERAHDEGERIPGSGLGLAIVREQVEAHGGRIELESELGCGAKFRVYLPLVAQDEAAREITGRRATGPVDREIHAMRRGIARAEEVSGNAVAAATVLIVEDNLDMRRYIVETLAGSFRCLEADDGHVAVAIAVQEMPDLVICDVMLPGQDGFAVCREIRSDERTCHVPIVLLTALGDSDHRLSGLAECADDYLAKPFSERELLLRIRNLLDLRGMMQRRYARDLRFERNPPEGLGDRDRVFLTKLGRLLDARHTDPAFELPLLATALAVSERQLQRKLKALTGLTPSECLRDYRLQRAHERLMAGERSGEVAIASGFASHAHFSACFRARFGYPPSDAREHAWQRA
jgi:DNA-binding response OmpR family regulator